jgi:hypothetical protein
MKYSLRGRRATKRIVATAAITVLFGGSALVADAAPSPHTEGIVSSAQAEAFVSMSPTRILDTRGPSSGGPIGVPTAKPMQAGEQIDLDITGAGHAVPAGATAVVLNTTIDLDSTLHSFLSIWPKGEARPVSSTNNALPGSEVSNVTIARLGTGGAISVYNQQGQINLVLDAVGYLVPLNQVDGLGVAGNTVLNGTGAPTDATGKDGDYYIDNTTHNIYGPKTGGHWPAGTSLAGAQGTPGTAGTNGASVLNGTGAPTGATGANGDFYIDTNNPKTIYGPKAGGAWPAGTSLVGAQGIPGGLIAGFSAYSDAGATTIGVGGGPVIFDTNAAAFGTGITKSVANNSFTLDDAGTYEITYDVGGAGATVFGTEVRIRVNGAGVGPTGSLANAGVGNSGSLLVTAAAGDVIDIFVSAVLSVGALGASSIVITRVA